ncbi:MAG: InlB B-repeat-containing protein, partial [Bacteroidetes bacterium]|nr:InlB B-repeat-containing protein [Bacteroidota bacterium]
MTRFFTFFRQNLLKIALSTLFLISIMPECSYAVNATKDNPVLFSITGAIVSGEIRYNIVVADVFAQTYQSMTITYPKELLIQIPSALVTGGSSIWILSEQTGVTTKSATFILRGTGSRSAVLLRSDLESIYFKLFDPLGNILPPEGSKVAITAAPTKVTFFEDERGYAHYYEFIAKPNPRITWTAAYNEAKTKSMQDPRYPDDPTRKLQGYLATITSEEEQMKMYSIIATNCGWLGGTRGVRVTSTTATINAQIQDLNIIPTTTINKNSGITSAEVGTGANAGFTNININTGTNIAYSWYWACGPEAWTTYSSGTVTYHMPGTGTPLVFYSKPLYSTAPTNTNGSPAGIYHNFNNPYYGKNHYFTNGILTSTANCTGGEPNNSTNEWCLQFAWNGVDSWNDYAQAPSNTVDGYYVEYGGYPGDPTVEELGNVDVTTSSEVELVLPVIIQYRSTEDYRLVTGVGTTRDAMMNYINERPYTAVRNNTAVAGYTPYGFEFVGQQSDRDRLTTNINGDVLGFYSEFNQRIIFLLKPDPVNVLFSANFPGWTSADVSATSKTVLYDSPYGVLPTAIRKGYTFDGWFTAASGGTQVTAVSIVNTLLEHTLYAHWTAKTGYTVKYDLNGGTSTPIPDRTGVSWEGAGLLPSSNPTRTNWTFTGWNVFINGSKEGVTNSDTYGSLAFNDGDLFITLQAQWIEDNIRYVVIYHTNGATSPTLPNNTLSGSNVPVPMPVPVKTGYTFAGWYVENDGTGASNPTPYTATDNKTFDDLNNSPTETFIILGAVWIPKTYTVHYDPNHDGFSLGSDRTLVGWEQAGLVPAPDGTPMRTGYMFMGWNTQADGTGRTVSAGDTYALLVGGNDSASDTILFAQWLAERTYTVRYELNGALSPTSIADKTVYLGSNNLLPVEPITPPVGFNFAGWAVIFNGSKTGVTNTDIFGDLATNSNEGYIVLQVQWSPKSSLTVQYVTCASPCAAPAPTPATIPNLTDVVWTQTHLLPQAEPTRTGYTFLYWQSNYGSIIANNSSSFGALANNNDTVTTVILTAQWASNTEYHVLYNVNGGTTTSPVDVIVSGRTAIVPVFTPDAPTGYYFTHWNVQDNGWGQGTTNSPDGTTVTFGDLAYNDPSIRYITLRANYAVKNTYKVIYNFNYLDATPEADTLINVSWTQTGLVPHTAYRGGFSFVGWTTELSGGTTAQPAYNYGTLAGGVDKLEVNLYAQWEVASFYVRYDLNSGSDIPPVGTGYLYEQRLVGFDDNDLIPPSFARNGLYLSQWNVSENGSKTNVLSTDTYRALANIGASYITLQAQWTPKSYDVHFDVNGAPIAPYPSQTGIRWWTFLELGNTPALYPPGYVGFICWKPSVIGATVLTPAEIAATPCLAGNVPFSQIAVTDEVTTASITLQAQYEEDVDVVITYTALTGGTVSRTTESLPPATGIALGSKATASAGYTFDGWYDATDLLFTTKLSSAPTFIPSKDVNNLNVAADYVALFEEKSNFRVIYNSAGGSAVATKTGVKWTDANLLPTGTDIPTRAGYTFLR